jgi:hypothetical protein
MTEVDSAPAPTTPRTRRGSSRGNLRWLALPIVLGIGYLCVGFLMLRPGQSNCNDGVADRARIQELVAQGQPSVAAGLADLALAQSDTCSWAWPSLATLGYRASMQDVYAHRELDGPPAIQRWERAEDRAVPYGVPPDPPMTVADNAYHAGMWGLAREAFQRAWAKQQTPADLPLYYSTLRSWGVELIETGSADDQQAGVHVLATACEIAVRYDLRQQQACSELDRYTSSVPGARPAPLDDPILQGAPVGGPPSAA